MASITSIPPELLLEILNQAVALTLQTPPLLIHGQFSQLSSSCRTCCFRQLAGVCKTWMEIAKEEFTGKEIVFGVFGSEKDDEVLSCVAKNEQKASKVKKVDASLRCWQGWKSLPMVRTPTTARDGEEEDSNGFLQTREAQLEKERLQVLNRDRQRLFRLLTACTKIEDFDIDVGFYSSIPHTPTILPSSIRTLTLRNCDAQETFDLVGNLPLLENLTLRLALNWTVPVASPPVVPKCRLRKFELSFTAFASATLKDVLLLLASSMESLVSLTVRNKGTTHEGLRALLPISAGLIQRFSSQLEHLSIKDIPRAGRRAGDSQPTWSWFPNRPTSYPRLRSLQLTGMPSVDPDFFRSTLQLPSNPKNLERLIIEDFDSPTPRLLVDALNRIQELEGLKLLEVAFRQREEGTEQAEKEIQEWCKGEGRIGKRRSELRASWRMKKIDHYCGFW